MLSITGTSVLASNSCAATDIPIYIILALNVSIPSVYAHNRTIYTAIVHAPVRNDRNTDVVRVIAIGNEYAPIVPPTSPAIIENAIDS